MIRTRSSRTTDRDPKSSTLQHYFSPRPARNAKASTPPPLPGARPARPQTPGKPAAPTYCTDMAASSSLLAAPKAGDIPSPTSQPPDGTPSPADPMAELRSLLLTMPTRVDLEAVVLQAERNLRGELQDLRAELRSLDSRIAAIETAADVQESRLLALEGLTASHSESLIAMRLKADDLENRSRRNNIRLRGIPESTADKDLRATVTAIFHQVLGSPSSAGMELDRVHRLPLGRSVEPTRPRDVLCRVHYYREKEAILQAYGRQKSMSFRGTALEIFPDLSGHTLYMRRTLRPLLAQIISAGATYRWGFPFHLSIRKQGAVFNLHHPSQLSDLFIFLSCDPVDVPDWLAESSPFTMALQRVPGFGIQTPRHPRIRRPSTRNTPPRPRPFLRDHDT